MSELLVSVRGGVATVTLNRPAVLNALSMAMLEGLGDLLDRWERDPAVRTIVFRGAGGKAFCAGGDIRVMHASVTAGTPIHRRFMEVEYALDHRIYGYPKPIVAHMDGIVMGGGMGIAQGAALRIVSHDSVEAIAASLAGETHAAYRPWAEATLAGLHQRSPTMLKVTLELQRRGRHMALDDCFRMELAAINAAFGHGDLVDGIRARIIDKDNRPTWRPARLEDVDRAAVEAFFEPRWKPREHSLASLTTSEGP